MDILVIHIDARQGALGKYDAKQIDGYHVVTKGNQLIVYNLHLDIRCAARSALVDQSIGYRAGRWSDRTFATLEPLGILEFVGLQMDLSLIVIAGESQHELRREGPALTAVISDVLHLDAGFLEDFAFDSMFGCLACLDESCDAGIHLMIAMHMLGEQYPAILAADDSDDAGFDAGEDNPAA